MKRATDMGFGGSYNSDISIHALVKRATEKEVIMTLVGCISIHALVKRATVPLTFSAVSSMYFNPRPREEGDILKIHTTTYARWISIHALVKRATRHRHLD